ncbi:MAG: GH92 family glycosyl hydrolase [Paramuribaculum sp.]|nr:GH92 family glycosyl hydrolase [Paramuribaculum sp.]
MKAKHLLWAAPLLLASCSQQADQASSYTSYVDTHIGSGGHGHVFMGANVPYGMVQLGPTSVPQTWDWCSGYHESDSTVIGFSHTHLEGTGIGDLFDVTVMPVIGDVTYARGNDSIPGSGMWSYADRTREISVPGYYSVPLTRYNVLAELTATNRVGLHRYTFPAADSAAIVFDLQNGGCWDKSTETHIEAIDSTHVQGYRYSTGWAKDQKVYFYAELSKPMTSWELKGENNMYGRASFATDSAEQVLMKVAISPVSVDGAKANMAAELPGWDFEATRQAADQAWNNELSRIKITTNDSIERTKFYSALYRTMIVPATFNDVDGSYRGADLQVHKGDPDQPNYTIFSLWDTYRAAMPLISIINPDLSGKLATTMVRIADEQGRLPVWHLWANETDCMVGNPGIIAVADAIVKQAPGLDRDKAYAALLKTAADTARGYGYRVEYGFIPCDKMNEAIAYDMEFAIADGAIARAAEAMGDTATMRKFTERSHSYRHYFDPVTRFIRGRMTDGSWRTPFSPFKTEHRADDYCEGNAWQYTWLVPQDVEGLEQCFGSREALISKLDSLFTVSSQLEGADASPDISGLIGQYAHGNEPSHHTLYIYSMLGQPDKTAEKVRYVCHNLYKAAPDGMSGNEDAGQMSAWYILSSLGFYQVEPASGRYWFGSPMWDEAEFAVPGGKFVIKTVNNSPENMYVRSVKLNGKPYTLPYIMHSDIMQGGELIMEMGPKQ